MHEQGDQRKAKPSFAVPCRSGLDDELCRHHRPTFECSIATCSSLTLSSLLLDGFLLRPPTDLFAKWMAKQVEMEEVVSVEEVHSPIIYFAIAQSMDA